METKQQKELLIIGTLMECEHHLDNGVHVSGLSKNLRKMYSRSSGIPFENLNESFEQLSNAVEFPKSKNKYAYYSKVLDFLNGCDAPLMESIDIQNTIKSYKAKLRDIIDKLNKQNDFEKYSESIMKIKISIHQPIMVYGYDLITNFSLLQELSVNFGLNSQNILAVVYDKYSEELLFVGFNSASIVKYSIKTDKLERKDVQGTKIVNFVPNQYFSELKDLLGINDLHELYVNTSALSIEFTDNIYQDKANSEYRKNIKTIVK